LKTKLSAIKLEVPAKVLNANEAFASVDMAENEDVMYVGFTLCHEGSNSKGDRFTRDELRRAWHTIAHKPINWEHEEPNLGVVLDAALKLPEPQEGTKGSDVPAQIDCVGIVWRFDYPEYAELISKAAADGSLRVSMEAYFKALDYVIGDFDEVIPDGDFDDEIASYVGTYAEKYDNKFVSRALKNVIFGGVGITAFPADEEARIWACAHNKTDEEYHQYLHDIYEGKKTSLMKKELVVAEHEKLHWKLSSKQERG
jgi:hypothetical protein